MLMLICNGCDLNGNQTSDSSFPFLYRGTNLECLFSIFVITNIFFFFFSDQHVNSRDPLNL
jgi:hypothetical protein